MKENVMDFAVVIERDEEGTYIAKVPSISGCYTQGKTIQQVLERVKEAIGACIEASRSDSG